MTKNHYWFLAALMIGQGAGAQEEVRDTVGLQQLDEVVASDSKFGLKRENSGKMVIKITAAELQRNQGLTVAQIINAKSGIEISGIGGRDGDLLGVCARGGRGRQVLILIDGARVSDPWTFSQKYDLRLLSPAMSESMESMKGAASSLYGTYAATAMIKIQTIRGPKDKIGGTFSSTVGTH